MTLSIKELSNHELNLELLSALLEEIYGEGDITLSDAEYFCVGFCHESKLHYGGTDNLLEALHDIDEIINSRMNEDKSDIIISLNKEGIELIESLIENEMTLMLILQEAGKTCEIAKDVK